MSFAAMGLVLIVDQLLLPMFHVGAFSYKISYFLLVLWFGDWIARTGDASVAPVRAEFLRFATAMFLIVACALMGELLLLARYPIASHAETARSVLIYVLVTLSFGLGLSARRFKAAWLIPVFYAAVALNFGFIFLRSGMPSWLVGFYYPQQAVDALGLSQFSNAADLLELTRSRGLFANPNVSAHMVNIIVLFICLAQRKRVLATPGNVNGMGIVVLPVALSAILASRGEFLVAAILGFLNFRLMLGAASVARRFFLTVVASLFIVAAGAASMSIDQVEGPLRNVERILGLGNLLGTPTSAISVAEEDSISRPLVNLKPSWDRFSTSPLFGTGFSVSVRYPFDYGTEYFHNDWFRVAVTSGLIGLVAMFWIINRYCRPLGWPALIPFVLPGMINTFQGNIPAFMFYFFMVAVLHAKLRGGQTGPAPAV